MIATVSDTMLSGLIAFPDFIRFIVSPTSVPGGIAPNVDEWKKWRINNFFSRNLLEISSSSIRRGSSIGEQSTLVINIIEVFNILCALVLTFLVGQYGSASPSRVSNL